MKHQITLVFDTETGKANFIDWYMKNGELATTYKVKQASADHIRLVPQGNACQHCEYWDEQNFGEEGQPEKCPKCQCTLWETKKASG